LNNAPNVAALSAPAVRGGDNINNIEQVTLDSVVSGPSIISVYGADIPQGPQKYTLVYEFLDDQLTLTYPQGGESFVHGRTERIRWDAFGNNAGNFTLEYSDNAGTSWVTLSSTIAGDRRYYDWTPPSTLNTGQMKMRISRGSFTDESDTLFTVLDVPKNLIVDTACGTIFHLTWDAIPSVTGYNIYTMGPKYMTLLGTSTTNGFTITTGVNTTDTFYFAVSGVNATNGAYGLRTLAYVKMPGNVNCVDNAWNVETILPFKEAYNCAITSPQEIKVKIKNIGFRPLTNLPIFYQVNANPVVSEVLAGPVAIGDSTIYTFTTLVNMAAPITYNVRTWTNIYTDVVEINDTSEASAVVLIPTTLTAPTVEDFEGPLFPPTGWRVIDNDASVKWQKTLCLVDPTGFNTHTAYMDFFNYTSFYQMDDLETAQIDLTGVVADTVLMTFDVSHAYGVKGIDSLRVLISDDCAANFTSTTYYKGGIPLSTAGSLGTIFSPTLTTQWRNDRIDLTSFVGKKIFLRFRGSNMNGNNLFIDNINIMLKDAWPLSTTDFGEDLLSVYPNPSDGNYTLEFHSTESKDVRYSIYNVAGQKVKENKLSISAGHTKTALNISNMASGMYVLELRDGSKTKKIKLSKF
ncbi:MAG TPA: T9SS type A sorting domain-containing protein, partial [Chitinophagaceae bacterium]|nr:T9SS type A sorting domain-containing protein [Chitinophagaceae bacterium]